MPELEQFSFRSNPPLFPAPERRKSTKQSPKVALRLIEIVIYRYDTEVAWIWLEKGFPRKRRNSFDDEKNSRITGSVHFAVAPCAGSSQRRSHRPLFWRLAHLHVAYHSRVARGARYFYQR